MKKVAVISLIMSSLLLGGCNFDQYTYGEAYKYQALTETLEFDYNTNEIDYLNIDWIKGEIVIEDNEDPYKVTISAGETDYPAYYYLDKDGNTLDIKYVANHTPNSVLETLSKNLTISVGKKNPLYKLALNLVSTTAKFYNTSGPRYLDINCVDATILGVDMYAGYGLNINSVSSVIEIEKLAKYSDESYINSLYVKLNLVDTAFTVGILEEDGYHIEKQSLIDCEIKVNGLTEKENFAGFIFDIVAISGKITINKVEL